VPICSSTSSRTPAASSVTMSWALHRYGVATGTSPLVRAISALPSRASAPSYRASSRSMRDRPATCCVWAYFWYGFMRSVAG
jgi:hypothetical protein